MPVPAAVLALWSLFVWGARIRNALDAGDGAGPVVLAVTFVVLALAVLATRGRRPAVVALAGWTTAVWLVRAVDIVALSDHPGPFKAVHAVLAVVSIALSAWAVVGVGRSDRTVIRSGRARRPIAG